MRRRSGRRAIAPAEWFFKVPRPSMPPFGSSTVQGPYPVDQTLIGFTD
jgi:hypothetical protein